MAKWMLTAKKADFEGISKKHNIDPVIARIMRNRDICTEYEIDQYLYGKLEDLHNPFLMKDMRKGTDFIADAINKQEQIRIMGDYDIDGVCSTYILEEGLSFCGAIVDCVIPHRTKDGYGINTRLIEEAKKDGIKTIITCDNGISAFEQILLANSLDINVIVTDHHEIPYEDTKEGRFYKIPPAVAVIDPKQEDCNYPYKGICGGVVAYKFVEALCITMNKDEEQVTQLMRKLLEIAAFATVGDVMELRDENRIIVKYGLKNMEYTQNIGLKALMDATQIAGKKITPFHVGFVLGPCMNATGRLDTAARALHLLNSKDTNEAAQIAGDLKALNDSRKDMTLKGVEQAIEVISKQGMQEDKVLVIYIPDCHESIAGIIAGRIKELYQKPVFVLTKGEEGVKGSGRSIEAYSMYEEMNQFKELFTKFGGHKMAAGLSMPEASVTEFRKKINENCSLKEEDFEPRVQIDVAMPISYITKDLIMQMDLLEPFGNGNEKPVFAQKEIAFLSGRIMGKNKNVGKYLVCDENKIQYELIYFGDIENFNQYICEKFGEQEVEQLYKNRSQTIKLSIVYYPGINEYMGKTSIQLVMQHFC